MQAIMLRSHGGPEVLQCVDVPIPVPASGEVLVRVHTIGVGKPDVLVRTGTYAWNRTLPVVLGHEMAGHVVALGEGVAGVAKGQAVLVINAAGGGYAEYAAVPAGLLMPLPDGMDVERAVGALNYLTAWVMLHELAQVTSGQTLYFNGAAGGVGTAIIQLARLAGVEVIAGASSDEKCNFASARGAGHTLNYSREDPVQRVMQITGGTGVQLMLDQFVGPNFGRNFEMLATFGQVVVYNLTGGMPDKNVLEAMTRHIARCPALRVFSLHCYDDNPVKRKRILSTVIDLLASGKVATHVNRRMHLAEARQAHELLDAGQVLGKLLLKPPATANSA